MIGGPIAMNIKYLLTVLLFFTSFFVVAQQPVAQNKNGVNAQQFFEEQLAKPKIDFTETEKINIADTSGYKIKSGKIIYEFVNGPFAGTLELIFDDYGKLQSEYEVKSFNNNVMASLPASVKGRMQQQQITQKIKRNDSIFIYTSKSDLPQQYADPSLEKGTNRMTQELMERNVFPIKQEEVLGKDTTVANYFNEYVIWFWKGIILKQEKVRAAGEKVSELKYAVSIDEKYQPKASDFQKK